VIARRPMLAIEDVVEANRGLGHSPESLVVKREVDRELLADGELLGEPSPKGPIE
jgi:hypothetical protein